MEVVWRRFYLRDDGPEREQRHRSGSQNSGAEEVPLLQG
jgi:hypothetical protein